MPDGTYQPKVYRKDGGNTMVVADGGKIVVEAGGEVDGLAAVVIQPALEDLGGSLTGTVDGALADIAATAAATAGGSSPSAAQVDAGIATAVASIVTGTNTQIKELQTKVNALLDRLRDAGVISTE